MGRYEGYLLCSDYDGTLVGTEGGISKENADAIRDFANEGGQFTVASGRSPGFIRENCADISINAPILSLNGGAIVRYDDGTVLNRCRMPETAMQSVCETVEAHPEIRCVEIWHGLDFSASRLARGETLSAANLRRETFDLPIYKILFVLDSEAEAVSLRDDCLSREGSRFLFERSWNVGVEMLPLSGGKGNALLRLIPFCDRPVKCTVGVGDFENDVSLIRSADIGYAVENAVAEAKAAADRVTVKNTRHAIRQIIEELPPL